MVGHLGSRGEEVLMNGDLARVKYIIYNKTNPMSFNIKVSV
jgi:hypothetical protein